MKSIPLLLVIAFMFFATQRASAQSVSDSLKLIPGYTYLITKTDNAQLKGAIINQGDSDVMVNVPNKGTILIHKADIQYTREETPNVARKIKESHGRLTYFEIGAGGGSSFFFRTALTRIFKNDQILSAGFYCVSQRDPDMPDDIQPDVLGVYPQVAFSAIGVQYGKAYVLPHSLVRCVIKGGIAVGTYKTPKDYVKSYLFFGYYHSEKSVFAAGILFQPEIQFPLTPHFGINVGGYIDINTAAFPTFGFDATLMFGKIMERKHKS